MANRVGHQLGNYRLIQLLGEGGFAEVYLGEHVQLGTHAALKLLHTSLLTEKEVRQFRQEARTIAHLTHPHIIRVLDFDAQDGMPYLVMDYAPGGTLRQKYPPGAVLPLALIVSYVQQIATGLQYAHDHQVVHRDIKPHNILLGRQNEVLLTDFGISIIAETSSRQQSQAYAGTATYSAPEQFQGHPGPGSDQYALAMLAYEWLVGTPAFTGSMMEVMWKQVNTPPPPLRRKLSTLPAAVEQVILKALAKDPRDRYPTIQAFAHALADASTSHAGDLSPQTLLSGTVAQPSVAEPSPSSTLPSPALQPAGAPLPVDLTTLPEHPFPGSPPRGTKQSLKVLLLVTLIIVFLVGAGATGYLLANAGPRSGPQTHLTTPTGIPTTALTATPMLTPTPPPPQNLPYAAQIPGPACDAGGAQWSISDPSSTTGTCSSSGFIETNPFGAPHLAEVYFQWPGHAFARNYSVDVIITNLIACAGVMTRKPGQLGGYSLYVCGDGVWKIVRYAAGGSPTEIARGSVATDSMYRVHVVANGTTQGIAINSGNLNTTTDASYLDTTSLALVVDGGNASGAATFSSFLYTPLP